MTLAEAFGRRFLEAEGRTGVSPKIHPKDEMLLHLLDLGRRPERAVLEYFRTGREIMGSVENVLACAGKRFDDVERALDFACGFGRFTRLLADCLPPERVWASDIVGDCVEFVSDTFGVNAFASTTQPEELALPGAFDLITVISLFSHLPRKSFGRWLRKLYESLSDDGLLLFSTHGPAHCPRRMKRGGFTFFRVSESRTLRKSEYGATFVLPEVVHQIAASVGVAHCWTLENDVGNFQNFHVVSKSPHPGLDDWMRTPIVLGHIDALYTVAEYFRLDGWAAEIEGANPLCDVRLHLDGREVATAKLPRPRPLVSEHYDRPEWAQSGWSVEDAIPSLGAGQYVLAAKAQDPGGRGRVFDMRGLTIDDDGMHWLV